MTFPDIDTLELLFSWGTDIKPYVSLRVITADDYKAITGEAYVAPTTQVTTTSTTN
ncbi:phage protein [Secundilactobacillus oryzae JCM 18671]|uniref:Phage protein n=1 Tax=Secundilactobacillus oryzae JCM 18671 TaxID=1291743 RepID=A0A081BI26_9LACO|nr:phage protein [Secundilactobacillus oryzae JCM 18671]